MQEPHLISEANGGYLDVHSSGVTNGARVQTWGSSGDGKDNQQWCIQNHERNVDLVEAVRAFAINFPGKVKEHTKGYFCERAEWGVSFITERIIYNKLWLCIAFPKNTQLGYQPVWDGIIVDPDGYISADCTVPYKQQGGLWLPPIPRVHRSHYPDTQVDSKHVNVLDTQISPDNSVISTTILSDHFGRAYTGYMEDLSDGESIENMGTRWVLPIGLCGTSERWVFDLGPEPHMFIPRYGCVAYHPMSDPSGNDQTTGWGYERFAAKIKDRAIIEDRRCNGILSLLNSP